MGSNLRRFDAGSALNVSEVRMSRISRRTGSLAICWASVPGNMSDMETTLSSMGAPPASWSFFQSLSRVGSTSAAVWVRMTSGLRARPKTSSLAANQRPSPRELVSLTALRKLRKLYSKGSCK